MGLLTRIWNGFRKLIGLVLPLFARARDFAALGTGFWAILHAVAILIIVGLLTWANASIEWIKRLLTKANGPIQDYFWLPLFFLIIYGLSWLGWWLWRLFWEEDEGSPFPDIDEAWEEALAALHQQGIDVRDLPLFLILGRPGSGEASLLLAARLQFAVQQVPTRKDSPIRVWAGPDGIYLTCAQASVSGRFAALMSGQGTDIQMPAFGSEAFDPYKTLPPQGKLREIQAILARAHAEGRGSELTDEERDKIRQLADEDDTNSRSHVARPKLNLINQHAEVDLCAARLRHLCHLVARDRRPFCPLNGILVLISLNALTDDDLASQAAAVCQYDLTSVFEECQLICPVFALVCDMESAPGFAEFLSRFPGEQKYGRLGQRFPLVSELNGESLPGQVEAVAQWICRGLLPTHIHKLFDIEKAPPLEGGTATPDQAAAVRGNSELYQFQVHVRKTSRNLGRVLTRAMVPEKNQTMLFGGCYLSGTGTDPNRSQGFVAGVFRRLKQCEDSVSWSDAAFAEEAEAWRWTWIGSIGLVIFVLGVLAAGLVVYFRFKP